MSIKSFTINDTACTTASHPCQHPGLIELTDGSKYEGLICSSISNAIIANISLKCLNLVPAQNSTTFPTLPNINPDRALKFLSHIHFYQNHKGKPLQEVLKSLPFVKNVNTRTVLTGHKLDELKLAISKLETCTKNLAVTQIGSESQPVSLFDLQQAPVLYQQLKDCIAHLHEFVARYPAMEEEVRTVAPYLCEADLALHNLSSRYKEHTFNAHINLLKNQMNKVRSLANQPNLSSSQAALLQQENELLMKLITDSPLCLSNPISSTSDAKLERQLNLEESDALYVWDQAQARLKAWNLTATSSTASSQGTQMTIAAIEKKLEIIEKRPENMNAAQTTQLTVPEEFTCPLSHEIMNDPVITPNGTTCDKAALIKWLNQHSTCPFTRAPLSPNQLVSNRVLKDLIEKWKTENAAGPANSSSSSSVPNPTTKGE